MENALISNLTLRQLNEVVQKLGGDAAALLFLSGDVKIVNLRQWKEHDGVINFSVTSDGTSGSEWIGRLQKSGFTVTEAAQKALSSDDFKPTNGTFEISVLKGDLYETRESRLEAAGPFHGVQLIDGTYRNTRRILRDATWRKLKMPTAEIACLIREKFSNSEIGKMGINQFIVMQEVATKKSIPTWSIKNGLDFLSIYDYQDWPSNVGFVFVASAMI